MKLPLHSGRGLYCIVLVIILLSSPQREVLAQRYFTRTYSEVDGLASSMIFSIAQDTSGILWFATRSGLSSYDGLYFKNYNIENEWSSPSFFHVLVDEKGKLWAMPSNGNLRPCLFDGRRWKSDVAVYSRNKRYDFTSFEVFYHDNNVSLLCGTAEDGLFLYRNGQWVNYTTNQGLSSNLIHSVSYIDSTLYIATDKGLDILRNNTISNFPLPELRQQKILALAKGNKARGEESNKTWILTDNWMGFLEDTKLTVLVRNLTMPVINAAEKSFIHPDILGGIYFGNPFGLYYYAEQSRQLDFLDRYSGLITDGATDAFSDREGNVWISGFRGITKISSRRFSSYNSNTGLFDDEVAAAIEWEPGKYAFGHYGVISTLEHDKFSAIRLVPSEKKRQNGLRVLDLATGKNGNLWAAVSNMGFARIGKNNNIKWYSKNQGISNIACSILVTPEGEIFAATNADFFAFNNGKFVAVPLGKRANHTLRKLFYGKEKSIFIATNGAGLIEYNGGTEKQFLSSENTIANNVFSFLLDSKDNKWVGTAAGLYVISGESLKKPQHKELTITRPVYLILEDKQQNIWFGTDNGLYRWNGEKMDHLTVKDGISGQEINRSAGFVDHLDNLWFGTNNGLTFYQPKLDYDMKKVSPPLLSLLFVRSESDSLSLTEKIVLKNYQDNLVFHFRIISMVDEKQVFFKYFLEGNDGDWSEEKPYTSDQLSFTNLTPGKYRLGLKARNVLGIWSEEIYSETITVMKPFWLRWWFIAIVLLLLALFLFLAGRFILVSRYNTRLEATVEKRTLELRQSEEKLKESNAAKDKFFSIIAHDLKSPFTSILGMLDLLTSGSNNFTEQEKKRILLNLKLSATKTFSLLDNLLNWARIQKGKIPFHPHMINLSSLLHDTVSLPGISASEKNITVEVKIEEPITVYADRNMIQTVIRNLLSNAIKFTPPDGKIEILAEHNDGHIKVSIIDNGYGIAPNTIDRLFKIDDLVITRDTNNEKGTGLGLILCKEFIEKNKGEIGVSSQQGKGSTFWFTLPPYPPEVRTF